MSFEPVCRLGDLTAGQPARFEVDGVPVSVVLVDREVHAINDVCTHAEVSLSEGDVSDCTIECWLHGSRFDLRTGRPTSLPATQPVAVYPVRIEGAGPTALVSVNVTES